MEIISGYVKAVAFFMIFGVLVEIAAPSGSFKKYVRLIVSLMIIALILEPLGAIVGGAGLEGSYYRLQSIVDNSLLERERSVYEKRGYELVITEYTQRLNERTKQVIEARTGFNVKSVDVVVNEDLDSESFAELTDVYATILYDAPGEPNALRKALVGGAAVRPQTSEDVAEKIKSCLTDFYNLPESNIHITVQGN